MAALISKLNYKYKIGNIIMDAGENDEVVKLYDLSSVCSELMDVDANPYTLVMHQTIYFLSSKHSS